MLVGITSAFRGLTTNKLRSFLTMLGVIFGVAAVIVAVALGQGSRDAAIRRFQKLGTTTLSVFPGRMICVLGWQAYKDLFDTGPCVGRHVYIKGQNFKVVGLFVERGASGFQNEDDAIYVPVTTALRRLFGSEDVLSGIALQGRSEAL